MKNILTLIFIMTLCVVGFAQKAKTDNKQTEKVQQAAQSSPAIDSVSQRVVQLEQWRLADLKSYQEQVALFNERISTLLQAAIALKGDRLEDVIKESIQLSKEGELTYRIKSK